MNRLLLLLSIFFVLGSAVPAAAQCAMCKTNAENATDNKKNAMAAGLNKGIIVLAALPYSAVMVIGFVYYANWKRKRQQAQ